jgi:hypothetical protein
MVERQGWGEIKEGAGAALIRVLAQRLGRSTVIRFADGTEFATQNGAAWGRDYGDIWEHVTAHTEDGKIEFFYLSDVSVLIDPDSGTILASQDPAPGET